jgi:hypothetical protein
MKTLLRLWLFLTLAAVAARAAVEVVPYFVEEHRSATLHDDQVSRGTPRLEVTVGLVGPEAESADKYGEVKIDEATDDTGANLLTGTDTWDSGKLQEYANAFFRQHNFGGRPTPAPEVAISLPPPKRSATKIARLRGSLSLAEGGTTNRVELSGLKGAGKKTLPVPEKAHATVVASVAAGDNVRSVEVEITGDENAVESLEVFDAAGQKVSTGTSTWAFNGGPPHRVVGLSRPVDDSLKLVAKIITDRKITKVPFDLKDIPLP